MAFSYSFRMEFGGWNNAQLGLCFAVIFVE
jgi:hypothetical protein